MTLRARPVPLVEEEHGCQDEVSFHQGVVKVDRSRGCSLRSPQRLGWRQEPPQAQDAEGLGDPEVRRRIVSVSDDGLLEVFDRPLQVAGVPPVEEVAPLEIEVVRVLARRVPARGQAGSPRHQLDLELVDHAQGDFVLDGEDVRCAAVEALRPEVEAAGYADQLDGDPQPVPGLTDAAFEHRAHAEPAADLAHIFGLPLKANDEVRAVTRSPSSCARALMISRRCTWQMHRRAPASCGEGDTATGSLRDGGQCHLEVALPSPASSAVRISATEAGHRPGSFSRHRSIRRTSSAGNSGLRTARLVGIACMPQASLRGRGRGREGQPPTATSTARRRLRSCPLGDCPAPAPGAGAMSQSS